jgi:predicted Na+-dependent transporter
MLEFVAGTSITIDATQMLQTILLMVVLPIFVHIPLRKVKNIRNFIVDYNPLLLIPMVWFTIVVPVARYRDKILADVENSLILVVGFMLLYLIYILFSLLLCRGQSAANRKSFIVASSIHNVTLGVVLAFLYLSNEVSYLVVFANISLILIIAFLKKLFVLVRVCQGE